MPLTPTIHIQDYDYELPDERIAKYPLGERDASKLLVWRQGNISHRQFRQLPELLQGGEVLFFNNTKVIPARLFFRKEGGSLITNFHQPCSTLLLLVSAFTGGDTWRDIYDAALENRYRFLSYGDSSMLWRG